MVDQTAAQAGFGRIVEQERQDCTALGGTVLGLGLISRPIRLRRLGHYG